VSTWGGGGGNSKSNHNIRGMSDNSGKMHRVQRTSAIQPDNHVPGCKILHRQIKWVKFHRVPIEVIGREDPSVVK
jgi:hypothetical protein